MSSRTIPHAPVVPSSTTGGITYPYRYLGSTNPIECTAHDITPTHTTSTHNFLSHHGYQHTPVAIFSMQFEDSTRVKGQPKLFHAQFTSTTTTTHDITIDAKVYTHKAFSNQQAAYRKDRYALVMVSPDVCYTIHGIVDNEKKRCERITRELRIDGIDKCAKKKRRQVFKINDSAVMMVQPGYETYPTYAFNTNATYTIVFYTTSQQTAVIHTGIRYTHNEHDVFVQINASHGGMITPIKQESSPIVSTRKRRITSTSTTTKRKRRDSDITTPVSPTHSITSSCISPISDIDVDIDVLPITDVTEQSFVQEKRVCIEPYTPFAIDPSMYQPIVPTTTSAMLVSHPLGSPIPSSYDLFNLDTIDPFTSVTSYDDLFTSIPDSTPTLFSLPSLSTSYDMSMSTSLFTTEHEPDTTNWLL